MSTPAQGTSIPSIFSFESQEVRTLLIDDQPWFAVKDVMAALDYAESSNPSRIVSHVPDEWRGVKPIHTPSGTQEMLALSEHGLYFFLGRSDKPKALPFQKWLAGEVLPAIRKTGRYEAASFFNPMSDEALANLRLSSPHGRWLLSFGPDGRAYLQQIARYSLLVEPKYLFKLLDAARDIQAFVDFFGLETHYASLREPCDLKSKERVRPETIPHPKSSLK